MTSIPSWLTPLKLPMPATLGSINVYLIRGPDGNALIDTGMNDTSSRKALVSQLRDLGLEISDIQTVLCTHHHADHAGLGKTFSETGAQVMMSTKDKASLLDFFNHTELDHERASFFGLHEVTEEFALRVAPMFPFFRGLAQPFEPHLELKDKQEIVLGGIPFTVLETPGHTMGHVCLLHEDKFVLTGDCVTSGNATHISMRRDVMGTDPLRHFIESLTNLGNLKVETALPGHGSPISDLKTRTNEIIKHHHKRLKQVEQSLGQEPRTAFNITADSMGPRPKYFARWLAMSQTLAYLEHLEANSRCTKIETPNGLCYTYLTPETR